MPPFSRHVGKGGGARHAAPAARLGGRPARRRPSWGRVREKGARKGHSFTPGGPWNSSTMTLRHSFIWGLETQLGGGGGGGGRCSGEGAPARDAARFRAT